MKIIKSYSEIIPTMQYKDMLKLVATAGRTCYKSDRTGTIEDDEQFIRSVIKRGHESVVEHSIITVKLVTSKIVSHQLVRHRIGFSYSQESQRYCNYSKDKFENEITFINPFTYNSKPDRFQNKYDAWLESCQKAEDTYFALLEDGLKPEVARSVLPNSTKTELIMTGNVRSWRHLLKLRTDKSAQRETRELMCEVLEKFKEKYPVFFEDL